MNKLVGHVFPLETAVRGGHTSAIGIDTTSEHGHEQIRKAVVVVLRVVVVLLFAKNERVLFVPAACRRYV